MGSWPSVTVAIPAYEQNKTLRTVLESVENQTYKGDIEVIVVDSSPVKRARSVVEDYPGVIYHWQCTHFRRHDNPMANVAIARDLGIAFASGKYVHLLDHDDILHITALERKVEALERHSGVGAAYTPIEKPDGSIANIPPTVTGHELRFILTYLRSPALPSTLMVERTILADCPPRLYLPHEDLCGLIEVLLRTDIGFIDEPLTIRNEPPNVSRTLSSQQGRLGTYDRYAGLRSQLITEERQREAREEYERIRDHVRELESNQ